MTLNVNVPGFQQVTAALETVSEDAHGLGLGLTQLFREHDNTFGRPGDEIGDVARKQLFEPAAALVEYLNLIYTSLDQDQSSTVDARDITLAGIQAGQTAVANLSTKR